MLDEGGRRELTQGGCGAIQGAYRRLNNMGRVPG